MTPVVATVSLRPLTWKNRKGLLLPGEMLAQRHPSPRGCGWAGRGAFGGSSSLLFAAATDMRGRCYGSPGGRQSFHIQLRFEALGSRTIAHVEGAWKEHTSFIVSILQMEARSLPRRFLQDRGAMVAAGDTVASVFPLCRHISFLALAGPMSYWPLQIRAALRGFSPGWKPSVPSPTFSGSSAHSGWLQGATAG